MVLNSLVLGSMPLSWMCLLPVLVQLGWALELPHRADRDDNEAMLEANDVRLRHLSPYWQKSSEKKVAPHITFFIGRVSHSREEAGFSITQSTPQSLHSSTNSHTLYIILL